jgi:hypothetical protein
MIEYKIKYDHPNHLNITTYFKHKNNDIVVEKNKKYPWT